MAGSFRKVALVAAVGGLLALPASAGAAVLYDQTDHAAPATADSSGDNFSPSNFFGPGEEDRTADDFTVPDGETWNLSEIDVGGAYSGPGATQEVNAYLYSDANGAPGAELFSQTGITATGPDYEVPLTGVPILTGGTYWITVQQADASPAFWSWQTRTTQSGSPAKWRSDQPGPSCDAGAWVDRSACWPSSNPDQIFELQGSRTSPPPPPPSPKVTLGELKLNKKRGTAKQPAYVNFPGTVALSGKNVADRSAAATAPGTVKLKVKPRGKTLQKLNDQGHARTKVVVTFTPDSGAVDKVKRIITLRKRG